MGYLEPLIQSCWQKWTASYYLLPLHGLQGHYLRTFNPLTTNDAIWHHLILATCYQLAQSVFEGTCRFCASKKGGIAEGGWVLAQGAVHMLAALAGCRKALVSTGWTISHLVSTNRLRNHSPPLVGAPILDLHSVSWSARWSESPDHWKPANEWVWLRSWTQRDCVKDWSFSSSFQCWLEAEVEIWRYP